MAPMRVPLPPFFPPQAPTPQVRSFSHALFERKAAPRERESRVGGWEEEGARESEDEARAGRRES